VTEPLSVGLLSASYRVGSTRRLKEALEARGHTAHLLPPDELRILVQHGDPVLLHKGQPLPRLDAVIPRIGASKTSLGTALVAQLEKLGVVCLNSAQSISGSRNKLRALQRLSRQGVGLPETVFLSVKGDVIGALEQVGGVPVIIKLLEGTQGIGVMLAESVESATAILETLRKTGQELLVQRFVAESRGRDVRVLVVGGRVIAAVRRVAQGTEFRSNVHRGSSAETVAELPPEYERTALRCAQILGLQVAGVDMLEAEEGPLVIEVNSSPSIDGMEKSTGMDLATPIVEHLEDYVDVPPLDVVQRLSRRQGYGVTEVQVGEGSALAGLTLAESGLRDRGLQVLCVERGGEVIPGPRGGFGLQVEDSLLLFGRLAAARDLHRSGGGAAG
jgi:ribosomal protein S6--L-glutamate ligase